MIQQVFLNSELKATKWKNGGGSTREIFTFPSSSNLDDFDLRCSIADVDQSGPFSLFPKHHRCIVQLRGAPMRLLSRDFESPVLLKEFESCEFDGSTQIACEVTEASRDYNFMVKKNWAKVQCRILDAATHKNQTTTVQIPPMSVMICFVMRGGIDSLDPAHTAWVSAREFDTIVWQTPEGPSVMVEMKLQPDALAILHVVTPHTKPAWMR